LIHYFLAEQKNRLAEAEVAMNIPLLPRVELHSLEPQLFYVSGHFFLQAAYNSQELYLSYANVLLFPQAR
jgi:hypothetical protein